ncbi:peptidyl-prolyl cis-trans isomerase FKBP17-2, chloroplastic-like [Nymphaea colorata]|nr:peptidyl-prolyl cis-trans isomerase FKBP17-2, chloroplastic-like [Nymphaea colorata]
MATFIPKPPAFLPQTQPLPPLPPKPAIISIKSHHKPAKANTTGSNGSSSNVTVDTTPESTDYIASTLSRRFGLGAGLAWAGFLSVGVIAEQFKTRFEASQELSNARDIENADEVVLPNGIRYTDMRIGGGASPKAGDLVVIDLIGKVEGSGMVFVDTLDGTRKSLALILGSRPYTKGMCEGIEYVLKTMKAGGRRKITIPSELGFGEKGADLGLGIQIPPGAALNYIVLVDKVSVAPA